MDNWKSSMNRKVHQRALNRLVRTINKSIKEDKLWQGRFYIHQIRSAWSEYADKSGAELWVVLEFVDTKTGACYRVCDTANHWLFANGNALWWKMNEFIVNYVKAWQGED